MNISRSEKGRFTNLSSEFYVLNLLYRLEINAHLTLNNKKSVDIVIEKGNEILTLDVKGLRDTSLWPLDNFNHVRENHFIVFVTYLNQFSNLNIIPELYIVPSKDIELIIYNNPKGNRKGVNVGMLRKEEHSSKYRNKWEYFL